jgi:hypothetical protein
MQSLAQLLALVLTAVALAPAAAHVLELPNKLPLHREEYLTVQQVYRGRSRLGFIVIAALIATFWMAVVADESSEIPATMAFVAILLTQVVFWLFTFPVNLRTHNWTVNGDIPRFLANGDRAESVRGSQSLSAPPPPAPAAARLAPWPIRA